MLNTNSTHYKPFKRMAIAALISTMLTLVGCGGGSSSGSNVVVDTTVPTDPAIPVPATPLISPGAYLASLNGKDWVGMLLPVTQGSSAVTNFYGLTYNSADPDLYSGSGTVSGTNTATLPRVFVYPNITGAVRSGTGTLSNMGNGAVRVNLSFPSSGLEQGKDLSVVASPPSNYKYNTAATLASIEGSWQGRLSYAFGYVDNFNLTISSQGAVSSSTSFQQDCVLTQGILAPNFDGTNLFTFSVAIPTSTQCTLKGQTLNGAAFTSTSPVAGKTKRLYIVGVTTDGRGISYKADR